MLLLLTEQVSRLASSIDSLTQAVQTAPAAEEVPVLQTQMHLKEVVQQELRPFLEQILQLLASQMQPARATLPAPAMLEAVQQALTPHLKGMAVQQQQTAQQQQLVRQRVPLGPTSRASDAAFSSELALSQTSSAGLSGGGCYALFSVGPSPVIVESWWPLYCADSGAGL